MTKNKWKLKKDDPYGDAYWDTARYLSDSLRIPMDKALEIVAEKAEEQKKILAPKQIKRLDKAEKEWAEYFDKKVKELYEQGFTGN